MIAFHKQYMSRIVLQKVLKFKRPGLFALVRVCEHLFVFKQTKPLFTMFDARVNNVCYRHVSSIALSFSEPQFSAPAFYNNNSHTEYVLKTK